MDHAVTVGDIIKVISAIGIPLGLVGLCIFVIWLFNPFRSGH